MASNTVRRILGDYVPIGGERRDVTLGVNQGLATESYVFCQIMITARGEAERVAHLPVPLTGHDLSKTK